MSKRNKSLKIVRVIASALFLNLFLNNYLFAQGMRNDFFSPLAKGTKIVADAQSENEFYVIAENDEPRLRQMLAEKHEPPKPIKIRKALIANKARVTKKTIHLKPLKIANKLKHHKPSKMELALNNALEKAISKKQFKTLPKAKHVSPRKVQAKSKQNRITGKIAAKKSTTKLAKK